MDIYCSQLGMVAELPYCLSLNEGTPCRSIIGCWRERTDIVRILRAAFTEEQLTACFGGPPKSKMERIVESVERANRSVPDRSGGTGGSARGAVGDEKQAV